HSSKGLIAKRKKKFVLLSPKTLGMGLLFISILLLLFWKEEEPKPFSSSITRCLYAPVSAIQSVRNFCSAIVQNIHNTFQAKAQLAETQEELDRLRLENQELHYKLRRHDHYREAFELPREEGMPVVTSIVLMRDNRMTQSLIINRGTMDGLDMNMPVLTKEGLLGRTTQKLTPHAAQVQPVTDPRSAVGVYIQGTPYEGILRGSEDGSHMILTDQFLSGPGDETLFPQPGDKVFTSGHGRTFPKDILAGIISDATSEDGLVVKPVVPINSVKAVMVLTQTQLQKEMAVLLSSEQ
ncbi:MAG: rod shape-determining protein MreC, partial [Candidatus Hinthialibacter sp.]